MIKGEKLYGIHPVLEALHTKRRQVWKIFIHDRKRHPAIQRITALAAERGIPLEHIAQTQLQQVLGHEAHQGIMALVEPHTYQPWEDARTALATESGPQTVMVLDGVTDVGNFASLIRAGAAFGVRVIIIPRHASVGLTPAVAKYSAGALERVALVQVINLARTLDDLKKQGFWVYGADMQGASTVAHTSWPERTVLVLGAEGHGMRRLVRERCDSLIRIPMCAGVDSLNVAVAGAIILAYRWDQCCNVILPGRD